MSSLNFVSTPRLYVSEIPEILRDDCDDEKSTTTGIDLNHSDRLLIVRRFFVLSFGTFFFTLTCLHKVFFSLLRDAEISFDRLLVKSTHR